MSNTLEHHRTKRGGLFVKDVELIERLGVPERVARRTLAMLDRDRRSGFPKKQPHWNDRRYWPAVEKWLEKTGGFPQENGNAATVGDHQPRHRGSHDR